MGCRVHRYGPSTTNLLGNDWICPGTRSMRGRPVANRRSPNATMKNPITARRSIFIHRVTTIAIPQGKYKSRTLTKVRIAGQAVEVVFGKKRPPSHAVGSTSKEISGTSKNKFTNFDQRSPWYLSIYHLCKTGAICWAPFPCLFLVSRHSLTWWR